MVRQYQRRHHRRHLSKIDKVCTYTYTDIIKLALLFLGSLHRVFTGSIAILATLHRVFTGCTCTLAGGRFTNIFSTCTVFLPRGNGPKGQIANHDWANLSESSLV